MLCGLMFVATLWAGWTAGRYQSLRRDEEDQIKRMEFLMDALAAVQGNMLELNRRVARIDRNQSTESQALEPEGEDDHRWN